MDHKITKPKEKKRYVINYSHEHDKRELMEKLLKEANQKPHGREITFKDLVGYALEKIGPRDLEKIKRLSLGEMDKVQMQLERYNQKHGTSLTLGAFLVKQLKIS